MKSSPKGEFSRVSLGDSGIAHVKETLADLLDLSRLLLKNVVWNYGHVQTFLPQDAPEGLLTNLQGDDIGAGNGDYIVEDLLTCMKNLSNPVFICEDTDSSPNDGNWPPVSEATKFYCNGNVYWFCVEASFERIKDTIAWAHSACLMNGALCELAGGELPQDGENVPLALLESATQHAKMVVVSAFDGAGFILWRSAQG